MPCDTIQTSQVQFLPTSTDRDLLDAAMLALGVRPNEYAFDSVTGALTIPRRVNIDQVKRAYSKEVVNRTAAKKGWKISWKQNEEGLDEATVTKRRYN